MTNLYTRERYYANGKKASVLPTSSTKTLTMNSWFIAQIDNGSGSGTISFNLSVDHPEQVFTFTESWSYIYKSGGRYYFDRQGVLLGELLQNVFPEIFALCVQDLKDRNTTEDVPVESYSEFKSGNIKDVVTKNFKMRQAAGQIINSPMEKTTVEFTGSSSQPVTPITYSDPVVTHNGNTGSRIVVERTITGSLPVGSREFIDSLTLRASQHSVMSTQNAINSAYGNINVGKLQALVSLGEAKSTIDHLKVTFARFLSLVRAIRSGKWNTLAPRTFRKLRRNPKMTIYELMEEAWWEARYAWRPLLIDAQNVYELIKGDKALSVRQTFRGKDEDGSSTSYDYSTVIAGTPCTVTALVTISQVARGGVLCQASSSVGLEDELSITNIVDAAVELVPFSFILQWFINLGGLLYTLRPNGSYRELAKWDSIAVQVATVGSVTYTDSDGQENSVSFRHTYDYYQRSTGSTSTLFSIDLNLDLFKIVDLVSLARRLTR